MKLKAKRVPYSSVVGGGVMLTDTTGAPRYQIMLIGTTQGIDKTVTDQIGDRLVELINTHGLSAGKPDYDPR